MNYEKQLNYPNMASVGNLQTQFSERLSGLLDRYNDLCNGPVSTHRPNQLGTKAAQSMSPEQNQLGQKPLKVCNLSSGQQ